MQIDKYNIEQWVRKTRHRKQAQNDMKTGIQNIFNKSCPTVINRHHFSRLRLYLVISARKADVGKKQNNRPTKQNRKTYVN